MADLIRDDATATAYPFWVIITPGQIMGGSDIYAHAHHVTGVWLSREAAQRHLDAKRHRYGDKAVVFTMSGHASNDWRRVCAGETPAEIIGATKPTENES